LAGSRSGSALPKKSLTSKMQAMKKQHIHQEILVSTGTTLAKKLLFETTNNNRNVSLAEKFEEDCWGYFLNEIFSELMPPGSKYTDLSVMGIYKGRSYFLIELADIPGAVESFFSINPHLSLSEVNMN
jgi:hypothetical protein